MSPNDEAVGSAKLGNSVASFVPTRTGVPGSLTFVRLAPRPESLVANSIAPRANCRMLVVKLVHVPAVQVRSIAINVPRPAQEPFTTLMVPPVRFVVELNRSPPHWIATRPSASQASPPSTVTLYRKFVLFTATVTGPDVATHGGLEFEEA